MRLTIFAGTAAAALALAAPALADGQMSSEATGTTSTMSERCDRLDERFRDAEVQDGANADVLEAEVLHERGTRACNGGNYAQGIDLIQQALRDIGAPAEVQVN